MNTACIQVLYADADMRRAEFAAGLLRGQSRVVTHFSSGQQLLSYLRDREEPRRRPSLILMDHELPGQGGRELLIELKRDDALRSIPVVVMHAPGSRDDVRTAYDCHANCCISRPASADEFQRVLRSLEEFWFTVAKLPGT